MPRSKYWCEEFNIIDSHYSYFPFFSSSDLHRSPVFTAEVFSAESRQTPSPVDDPLFPAPKLALISQVAGNHASARQWIIDSGASVHIVASPLLLDVVDSSIPPIRILTITGVIVRSTAAGPCTIPVLDPVSGNSTLLRLTCAYYIPEAAFNLLAVQRLQYQQIDTVFDKRHAHFAGALLTATTGQILCRIQQVGASLQVTCSSPHFTDAIDPSQVIVAMALNNRHRSRPVPVAAPSPSADDVTQLIRARNNQATGI